MNKTIDVKKIIETVEKKGVNNKLINIIKDKRISGKDVRKVLWFANKEDRKLCEVILEIVKSYNFYEVFDSFEDCVFSEFVTLFEHSLECFQCWLEELPASSEELLDIYDRGNEEQKKMIYKILLYRRSDRGLSERLYDAYCNLDEGLFRIVQIERHKEVGVEFINIEQLVSYYISWCCWLNKKTLETKEGLIDEKELERALRRRLTHTGARKSYLKSLIRKDEPVFSIANLKETKVILEHFSSKTSRSIPLVEEDVMGAMSLHFWFEDSDNFETTKNYFLENEKEIKSLSLDVYNNIKRLTEIGEIDHKETMLFTRFRTILWLEDEEKIARLYLKGAKEGYVTTLAKEISLHYNAMKKINRAYVIPSKVVELSKIFATSFSDIVTNDYLGVKEVEEIINKYFLCENSSNSFRFRSLHREVLPKEDDGSLLRDKVDFTALLLRDEEGKNDIKFDFSSASISSFYEKAVPLEVIKKRPQLFTFCQTEVVKSMIFEANKSDFPIRALRDIIKDCANLLISNVLLYDLIRRTLFMAKKGEEREVSEILIFLDKHVFNSKEVFGQLEDILGGGLLAGKIDGKEKEGKSLCLQTLLTFL